MKTTILSATTLLVAALATGCRRDESAAVDLPVISTGDRVELADHLEKGKYTLFVFGADW